MLNLYLMRHGNAESTRGKSDLMRELTPQGIGEAKVQGKRLKDEGITYILHSPFKRAVQTAVFVNQTLDLPMDSCEHLVPSGSVTRVLDRIAGLEEHFLLVCHLPIIAEIAYELSGKDISFYPATMACFQRKDASARSAEFQWFEHA